ncbi:aspartate kinase [Sporosalibacterium faouarense]|uniref:aspartate kinase n=1 Tax=Sporosalibacterium faouarense TaxID=516123 RepID=UPI00141C6B06|nr:aspartate kinase [Sporosalibacterium faouarense]MTI48722.1 aspartate kinase [Bacillota bacterium]
MNIIVQKYGGTSVESIEKMQNITNKIINKINQGHNVVVVASAMGKTTNQLLKMAESISVNPCKRELDMLMSTGEQVSISLLSMILKEKGYDSISLTGFQAGIRTEGVHTKNKIARVNIDNIKKHVQQGKIVVVAGFQGINEIGDITTLGRGGSDTTAVALAAKLECACEIYTDVEGIYSIDPRVYADAKKLEYISYEEMMEMSSLGAKVMEPRSVELGKKYNVPIYVASSHKDIKGTYIKEFDQTMEQKSITGLSVSDNVLMITVNHVPYSPVNISDVFGRLAGQDVNIDMISQTSPNQGHVNISFTTSKEDESTIDDIMRSLKGKYGGIELQKDADITKISVIGTGMRNESGVASKVFKLFADHSIEFKQVTTSEISISYTIKSKDKLRAVNMLAKTFNL